MVHSSCHTVGMVTSLFRRCYNRRRGYEPIPRCEAEEDNGESGKAQKELCEEKEEEGCKKVLCEEEEEEEEEGCKNDAKVPVSWRNEVREGESLEACGDRLLARYRTHHHPWRTFAAYKDLHYAACLYTHAGTWRKAALTYGELAAYCLKTGRVLSAGSALLRSAKCYAEIEDKTLEEVVATKLALDEALALFVRKDGAFGLFLKKHDLWLAASACSELAKFHMEHNELHSALVFYQRAAGYHGTENPGSAGDCRIKADHVKSLLAIRETLRAPLDDGYKRKSTGYMKPTDPDWDQRVGHLLSSTSIAHDRASFLHQLALEDLRHGAFAFSGS